MPKKILLLITVLLSFSLFALDYDCVFIGSSPISIFEAIYQHCCGKKVLIIDDAPVLGGAWKSLEICGIQNVDVGCHDIGRHNGLKEFLEQYGGCEMTQHHTDNGFYFSKGCYELISNLQKMLEKMAIEVFLNTRAERTIVDEVAKCVMIQTKEKTLSTRKIYMSAYAYFPFGKEFRKTKYYHLYLLIHDPTSPQFAYKNGCVAKTSRMMNLTKCLDLERLGQQLIVFQTHQEPTSNDGQQFLDELKKLNLVSGSAYILKEESYTYEQWPYCQLQGNDPSYFEMVQTHHFQNMANSIERWKQVLKPYHSF